MRRGILLLVMMFSCGGPLYADVVVEPYEVGGVFSTGVGGLDPGDQISFFNTFDTSPAFLGVVEVRDPRSVLPGGGNVRFTGNTVGQEARVEFDMGLQMADSTLPNSTLIDSEITFSDIDSDADATNFTFRFSAKYVDGTAIADLSELTITQTNGTFNFANLDGGVYQAELTSNTGTASISFSSSSGTMLRSMQFSGITPDFAADELVVSGSRTLNFSPVPEPSSTVLVATMFCLAALRRRKINHR